MVSVVVDGVSLDFPIYDAERSFRKSLFNSAVGGVIHRGKDRRNRVSVTALDNISLDIQKGDRIGLIGTNGAGKSTLLKIMAGIYEPDSGSVAVDGSISCLFGSILGIDDADNAYRNIYASCRFLGMSKEEITEKIPSIEEFCELGDYMSMPLRTYSMGMMARLSFAIATAMEPQILLMDEGIGAGDARFAKKAKARIDNFIGKAEIIVLASHSNQLIEELCNKAVLMQTGKIIDSGPVDNILATYEKMCMT
jgi:ABC-type polysaccharide/polyol phosphate transport system ATPase subunit